MEVFLSVADASRILGITPQTVRLMIRRGTLAVTARTAGGIQLFRRDDVEHLAAERVARRQAGPAAHMVHTAHTAAVESS
jgi:excisionase family DNA binding protein